LILDGSEKVIVMLKPLCPWKKKLHAIEWEVRWALIADLLDIVVTRTIPAGS
jgi:hypothetical protein